MTERTFRVVTRLSDRASENREAKSCQRCGKATRESKPFCPAHVGLSHYVAGLEGSIAERAACRAALSEDSEPSPRSLLADELLFEIGNLGSVSIARLARLTRLDLPGAERLIRSMERAGLVVVEANKRGALTVSLAKSRASA